MTNIFTSKKDLDNYRTAGRISAEILVKLIEFVKEGVTPKEVDKFAEELIKKEGVKASFYGVPGPKDPFPSSTCVSVNDETLHTIPNSERPFQSGDIVSIDYGIIYKGLFTDHCITLPIGEVSEEEIRLINTAKLCVDTAIKQVKKGNNVGDISNALGTITNMAGFTSIQGFAGHGIGRGIHMYPNIPYEGIPGTGTRLEKGMVLCIENQISMGSGRLKMDDDGWTLRTEDGSKTAMFEHVVLVTDGEPEVLTQL